MVSVESGEKEPARRTSLSAALLADQAYGFERCFPRAWSPCKKQDSNKEVWIVWEYFSHWTIFTPCSIYHVPTACLSFPCGSVVKNPPAISGDAGSIPVLGRSPGEGHGNPLQYFSWEIPWTEEFGGLQPLGLQKSQTWLGNWTNNSHMLAVCQIHSLSHLTVTASPNKISVITGYGHLPRVTQSPNHSWVRRICDKANLSESWAYAYRLAQDDLEPSEGKTASSQGSGEGIKVKTFGKTDQG